MVQIFRYLAAAALAAALSSQAAAQFCAPSLSADYSVLFEASWSAQTLPQQFPPNPHFSGLVGGVHNSQVSFWNEGEIASDAIEQMAETGGKSQLISAVGSAMGAGTASAVLSGGGIGTSPGAVGLDFSASQDYPLVTLVSMIAPSPDWFVGVSAMPLFDGNAWADTVNVTLYGYDAGTDSGTTYTSDNADTQPREPITPLTGPLFEIGGNVVPFGEFVFARQDSDCIDSDGDGVDDALDNCLDLANADQFDADGDGHGNACDADLNNDCGVNATDLGILRSVFFSADAEADFNGDGVVNAQDLGVMKNAFFRAPGPSAAGLCTP